MRRFAAILAILAANCSAGLNSSPAYAANSPGIPDGSLCTRAAKLAAGAVAPCAGDLLPSAVVAELLAAQDLSRQLASDIAFERENAAAAAVRAASDRTTAATEAAGVLAACARHRDGCEARLAALTAPDCGSGGASWWTVAGVGAVGVLIGVIVGAAAF